MKFCELISNNSWQGLKLALLNLYPSEKKNIAAYEKVYNRLISMDCASMTDMMISVENVNDRIEGDYVDVTGINTREGPLNDHPAFYAIEFCSWKQWLGMEISPESLACFSQTEIIAHCLYKMTFMGFAEKRIHQEHYELNKRVKDLVTPAWKNWFIKNYPLKSI